MACVELYDFPNLRLAGTADPQWLSLLPLAFNASLETRAMPQARAA
jgi:hypothetical protein